MTPPPPCVCCACCACCCASCLQDHERFDGTPVTKFLHALGMGEFAAKFADAEVDLEALQLLDEPDLADLGVSAAGARRQLLQGVAELRAALPGWA